MDYKSELQQLDLLEKEQAKRGPCQDIYIRIRTIYEKILAKWPYLEGIHIRYAHTTLQFLNAEAALPIFDRAFQIPYLNRSPKLWTYYLQFLVGYAYKSAPHSEICQKKFEEAKNLIGNDFLSHEFWKLYAEWQNTHPLETYLYCLKELTLHQVSTIYLKIITELDAPKVDLYKFREFAPPLDQNTESDLTQIKEVIKSKLRLQYELHMRRVDQIFVYEQHIKRPFFYPKPLPQTEIQNWARYTLARPEVLLKAIIPGAECSEIRLARIRSLINANEGIEKIIAEYKSALIAGDDIRQHYALFLEMNQMNKEADEVYANSDWKTNSKMCIQYAQFLCRQNRKPQAVLCLEHRQGQGCTESTTYLKKLQMQPSGDVNHNGVEVNPLTYLQKSV